MNAARSSCRSDFLANCSGVPRGSTEALDRLRQHMAKLSPACGSAVNVIVPPSPTPTAAAPPPPPPPAAAAAPPMPSEQQMKAIKFTCRREFSRFCKGVVPGGAQAVTCLKADATKLSQDCKTSLADLGDAMPPPAAARPRRWPNGRRRRW